MIKWKWLHINLFVPLAFLMAFSLTSMEYFSGNEREEGLGKDTLVTIESVSRLFPSDTVRSRLLFTVDSVNRIVDTHNTMERFYGELSSLLEGKDTVISIVHLGDSHIQAGFLGGPFMRLMHQQYGNAGRGWIAPFKLSKTNEPDDYFIHSSVREWTAGRSIQPIAKCPVGLGGIGIHTESSSIRFDIGVTPRNGAGYSFNKAVLYRGDRSMPMIPAGRLKDGITLSGNGMPVAPGVVTDTFTIAYPADTILLQSTRKIPGTELTLPVSDFQNVYYGLVLTNSHPGVLYHSIGVNGAMFVNYTDEHYLKQLALLDPSLLIVSLGTNETFGRRFKEDEFRQQIEDFIWLVRYWLPETTLLLTTPPECYKRTSVNGKRTYMRNEETAKAARAIVRVAEENNIAYWDLFQATGGAYSSGHWFKGKWMGSDRIHFNKEGYREQGVLLFKALHSYANEWSAEKDDVTTETADS